MKTIRNIFALFVMLMFLINQVMFGIVTTSAHNNILEISYDDCVAFEGGDGIDETWYVLDNNNGYFHLSSTQNTIKYYFEDVSKDGTYSWSTDISETVANEIKTSYANSMKKWNDVYFYSYDSYGNIVKNKIINVEEGTYNDHNLSIFPTGSTSNLATTTAVNGKTNVENNHNHWNKWEMVVYLKHFYEHDNYNIEYVNKVKDYTGAHELGHVLGLRDVDKWCSAYSDSYNYHHHELIMGYGNPMGSRSSDITYKDIAGVAITRGFHTDTDHKWLNRGQQSDGTYKLICSICNGVKCVNSLNEHTYNPYGVCNNNHTLDSGNMMAVASYGDRDYYKCKYCRYVAPFSDIVLQDYSVQSVAGGAYHKCTNNVTGLNYSFFENHNWINGECKTCGYDHLHTYNYSYKNNAYHLKTCSCGISKMERHFVNQSDIVGGRYANCIGCNVEIDLLKDAANVIMTIKTKVSVNGSYILPNEIVVLVDEDVEAYLKGVLQFYDADKVPDTE